MTALLEVFALVLSELDDDGQMMLGSTVLRFAYDRLAEHPDPDAAAALGEKLIPVAKLLIEGLRRAGLAAEVELLAASIERCARALNEREKEAKRPTLGLTSPGGSA